jgi:hypothetical protein
MHPIHSNGPKIHVLGHFGKFHYCRKVDAKLAELAPLTPKIAKSSCIGIFCNECTQSSPLDPKLMFRGVSDRFVTAQKSMQNLPNWCKKRTSSLNKVMSEFFGTNAPDPLYWTQNSLFRGLPTILLLHESRCKTCLTSAINDKVR